jgi:hypothetical protein
MVRLHSLSITSQILVAFIGHSPPPPPDVTCNALVFIGNFLYENNRIALPLTASLVEICLGLCQSHQREGPVSVSAECIEGVRVLACMMYERSEIDDAISCAVISNVIPFISVGNSMELLRHSCDCVGNIISKKGEVVQQHIAPAAASVVAVFEHLSVSSSVTADRVFQSSIRTLR